MAQSEPTAISTKVSQRLHKTSYFIQTAVWGEVVATAECLLLDLYSGIIFGSIWRIRCGVRDGKSFSPMQGAISPGYSENKLFFKLWQCRNKQNVSLLINQILTLGGKNFWVMLIITLIWESVKTVWHD